MAGRNIRDIDLPEGALIGMVLKGDRVVKPMPDLRIEEGDIVCIFALTEDVPEVERLLQVAIDFF
jgi:trk system potassium uptake protein TrkA